MLNWQLKLCRKILNILHFFLSLLNSNFETVNLNISTNSEGHNCDAASKKKNASSFRLQSCNIFKSKSKSNNSGKVLAIHVNSSIFDKAGDLNVIILLERNSPVKFFFSIFSQLFQINDIPKSRTCPVILEYALLLVAALARQNLMQAIFLLWYYNFLRFKFKCRLKQTKFRLLTLLDYQVKSVYVIHIIPFMFYALLSQYLKDLKTLKTF